MAIENNSSSHEVQLNSKAGILKTISMLSLLAGTNTEKLEELEILKKEVQGKKSFPKSEIARILKKIDSIDKSTLKPKENVNNSAPEIIEEETKPEIPETIVSNPEVVALPIEIPEIKKIWTKDREIEYKDTLLEIEKITRELEEATNEINESEDGNEENEDEYKDYETKIQNTIDVYTKEKQLYQEKLKTIENKKRLNKLWHNIANSKEEKTPYIEQTIEKISEYITRCEKDLNSVHEYLKGNKEERVISSDDIELKLKQEKLNQELAKAKEGALKLKTEKERALKDELMYAESRKELLLKRRQEIEARLQEIA